MKYTRLPTLPVFTEPGTPAESRTFIAYKAVAATALFTVSFFLGVVFDKVVGGNKASVAHCGDYGSINAFPDGTISQGNPISFLMLYLMLINDSLPLISRQSTHTPLP
jgi:hypothetical protein